jgi:hypothetical protein
MHFTNGLQALLIVHYSNRIPAERQWLTGRIRPALPFCLQISYSQENAFLYTK